MLDSIVVEPVTKRTRFRLREDARSTPKPWRWPLPRLGSRAPVVLEEHTDAERRGVDVGYAATQFEADLFVPVFAVQAGEVSSAIETPTGFEVGIDHGGRTFGTLYGHMSKMFVTPCLPKLRRRQWVRAGDVIGYAATGRVHVRFELWSWTDDRGFVAINPISGLHQWSVSPTAEELRSLPQSAAHQEAA